MIVNLSATTGVGFVAEGTAIQSPYGIGIYYLDADLIWNDLAHGDAIKVIFPSDVRASGMMLALSNNIVEFKEVCNLSGDSNFTIKAGNPTILLANKDVNPASWIIQSFTEQRNIVDFEQYSAEASAAPTDSIGYNSSSTQYIFAKTGSVTTGTYTNFIEQSIVSKTANTIKIDVTINSSVSVSSSLYQTYLYHRLRIVRGNGSYTDTVRVTSANENEAGSGSRDKGHRGCVTFTAILSDVYVGEPLTIMLGCFGGSNSTTLTATAQNWYIRSYNIIASHYY